MNSSEWKAWAKTPKGKLVLALGAMLLSWVFLLWNFSGSLQIALPGAERRKTVQQEIRKLRAELRTQQEKMRQAENQKKCWKELADTSWQPARDGDPELILRQKTEAAARKSELTLNNLGTVRLTRINADFSYAELDVSANASLSAIMQFIQVIQEEKPSVAWKRLSIFSMMRRPQGNNSSSRTVTGTTEDSLVFSGSLRTLVYNPETASGNSPASAVRNAGTENIPVDQPAPLPMPPPGGGPL